MKKILSVALAAVLASCATTPPEPAPAAPATGPVASAPVATPVAAVPKTVTYQEALPVSIKSTYPNGDPSGTVTIHYNAQGWLALQETYNGNGVLIETRVGKAKGDAWRITVSNAQNGEVISYEDRTMDAQGRILTQTLLNPKEVPQASNEYSYDANGNKILWLAKTGGGGLQARTVYTNDAKGNNVKTEVFDAGGTLTNIFISTFDDQGQLTNRKGYDASQNLVEQTNFTWKDGRKVKEETVKPLLRTIEYSYGDTSVPTGIVQSVRGKVVERQTLDYQWFARTKSANP